jgi:hypothetical protein
MTNDPEASKVMMITLVADVERYGPIAKRWPPKIILPDCTEEQLDYLLCYGLYETGCDDLYKKDAPE